MNMLLDALPKMVEVGGVACKIRTDFRISIMFELMMTDPEVTDEEKLPLALNLYYEEFPEDIPGAVEAMMWFYKCGRQENAYTKKMQDKQAEKEKKIYSFDYDDHYIYAAFLQQYGMDLNRVKGLHWWKFRALFDGLTDACEFVKIMGYRAIDITNDMSSGEKKFYRKMKKIYEIPLSQSEQDKQDAIEDALMNGGDISALL